MNISIKIPKSLSIKTISILCLIAVVVIGVFEVLAVLSASKSVTQAKTAVPTIKNVPVVRINFNLYEAVIKKITTPETPTPEDPTIPNPFKTVK